MSPSGLHGDSTWVWAGSNNPGMQRLRVQFTGRVQGVGFRATARSIARRYPITGWVRNEADGSVLLEAQGEAGAVQEFLEAISREMEGLIAGADHCEATILDREEGFEIRR